MCDSKKFVQLHCHSSGSLLDGVASIKNLVKRAKELGHPALALTDHGGPQMLYDHYKECKKQGIQPILGLEFYICNDLTSRVANKGRALEDKDYHQSTYIKNKEGYKNFCELTYRSFNEGYYYKPRIDFDSLFELKNGLMITSSCMASKTSRYIAENRHKEAEELFKRYLNEFGEDFYGEIQMNEIEDQKAINNFIIHLCKKYDVKMIIGGDVHYVNREDNELQDAVIRSKRASSSSEDEGGQDWTISARNLFYHDESDYHDFNKQFGYNYDTKFIENCLENSFDFSKKVNFEFETGKYHLPKIDTGKMDSKDYIEQATWTGLLENIELERKFFPDKYTDEEISAIEKQTDYELKVIDQLGLNDYLLIVHDIINWEKRTGIFVGPGRGCFLPGSKVVNTEDQRINIENVKVGDTLHNFFNKSAIVEKLWEYQIDEQLIELEFKNNSIIKCTKDHKFFTNNRGWVEADKLDENDDIAEIVK
jgi:DNA polymerase-3 subunit alpha